MPDFQFSTPDVRSLHNQRGAVALTATIIVVLAVMALSAGIYVAAIRSFSTVRSIERSVQAHTAAESGVEDMLLRLFDGEKNLPSDSESTIVFNGTSVTTKLAAGASADRVVTAVGSVGNDQRIVEVTLDSDATTAHFSFAAHIGDGGVLMQNNSEIIGTIFSNGTIEGNNAPRIVGGDAWAAEDSQIIGMRVDGDAHANDVIGSGGEIGGTAFAADRVDQQTIGGNVRANRIHNSTIGGHAYYETEIVNSTVAGNEFPETPSPDQVERQEYAITDEQLDDWQEEAVAGGTWGGECPLVLSGNDTLILGLRVVPCDVTLQNQAVLTIAGTVWVQGDLKLQNQAVLQLDAAYGSNDGVLIVSSPNDPEQGGTVEVGNQAQVRGSGEEGSFLLLVSRNTGAATGEGTVAIKISNGTSSSVFFTPNGEIEIQNNVDLVAVTAYRLRLQNSATVEYDEGLANMLFSSGPQGGWQVLSWREAE